MKILSTGTLEVRTCITQEPYVSNSMETHGSLSLKLHSNLSSFHSRTLDKKGQNWTCYSYICIDLNTLHTSSTVPWKNNTGSSTLPAWPHLHDTGTGPGAGRGVGLSCECHPEAYPGTLGPGSPHVHIQGNLSTDFKENGDMPRKDAPHSCLPGPGPAPLVRWTQFPSHHRAGLHEGDVQTYLVGGSNQLPLRLLGLSQHPAGKLYQHVCIERSLES